MHDDAASEKPSTLPPSSIIAASNESLVLVLGSKKKRCKLFAVADILIFFFMINDIHCKRKFKSSISITDKSVVS